MYSQLRFCPDNVRHTYYEKTLGGQRKRPGLKFFRQCILDLARDWRLFLLVDAVDESSEVGKLTEFLADLGSPGHNISLLVMSRDDPEIERHLHLATRIRLEARSEHVYGDVQSYIDQRLGSEKLQWLGSSLKADIARSLKEKADGMQVSICALAVNTEAYESLGFNGYDVS